MKKIFKKWYSTEERKNIMYMAIGIGGVVLSLLCVAVFDSFFIATALFFIGGWGFMMDWKTKKEE
jgi:hypothetical protein